MYQPGWADPATLDELAHVGVAAGYDALWLHDHLVTPAELSQLGPLAFLDPLIVAAHLASIHPDVSIGFATLVLPLREPVVLSKQLATLATFFPGRIIAGIGAGRYESEFERFGSDDYPRRGALMREHLALMQSLFADGPTTFEGTRRSVRDADMYPKPTHEELAIWLAAQAPKAIARAGRDAAGWITAGVTLEDFSVLAEHYRAGLEEAGRTWADRSIALSVTVDLRTPDERADEDLHRHAYALTGSADDVASALRGYTDAGVTDVLLAFSTNSLDDLAKQIRWFSQEVRPRIESLPT